MPTVQTVQLRDLASEIKDFGEEVVEAQRLAVLRGLLRSVPGLVKRSPVDTGLYANSWDLQADEKRALIGNFAPHAPIIEYGARPFTPPIGPLLAWAKRVLEDPSQPPEYSKEVWGLARYTQKKIERVGMKPHHILRDSFDDFISNIEMELKGIKDV